MTRSKRILVISVAGIAVIGLTHFLFMTGEEKRGLFEPIALSLRRASVSVGLAKEVHFADPNVEAAIRGQLKKPKGPITYRDLGRLQSVDLRRCLLDDKDYKRYIPALQKRGVKVLFHPKPSGEIITFADENLETAVRNALVLPERSIYESDMTALTTLSCSVWKETDVATVGKLTNLEHLELTFQKKFDTKIDLGFLSSLTNLRELHAKRGGYRWGTVSFDLSPLRSLSNLRKLDLREIHIEDITALSSLTELKTLTLGYSKISNISPLSGLTRLEWLELVGNQISDVSPLRGLTNLKQLRLWRNQISDIGPLIGLTNLEILSLNGNQISDIGPLRDLPSLRMVSLENNQIRDVSPLLDSLDATVRSPVLQRG